MRVAEMPPLAQLRSAYRQAIALDEERGHTPATRRLREAAQDRLAAVVLSDGEGGGYSRRARSTRRRRALATGGTTGDVAPQITRRDR